MDELPETVIGQPSASAGSSSPIPHRVVQYWEPLPPPPEMEPWLASWGSVGMPQGEHRLFSFDDGLEAVREAVGPGGAQAFAEAPHPAARADLFRYAELLLRGGWYVDAEHEALLAIPDVLTWPVDHVLVRRPDGGNIPNGFIGAVPGSVLLREVLDEACANVLQRRSPNILEMTGPGLFTRRAEAYMATSGASFVLLPANAVFADVLQAVHNEADYKVRGHWRDHDLTGGGPAPEQ
jgi:mannosyltransferase OCH1-like enzyme